MNKINKETLIKLIILFISSIFYIKLILTDDILKFIHPRLMPFIKFGVILMIITSIVLLFNLNEKKTNRPNLKKYRIFILPLIIMLIIDPSKDIINSQSKTNNSISQYEDVKEESIKKEDKQVKEDNEIIDDIIKVNDKNFLNTIDKIYSKTDNYVNHKMEITGFVFKDESFGNENFVIARQLMVCCASDMQVIGLLCKDNKPHAENSWLKITGVIKKNDDLNAIDSVYIEVEKSEEVEAPKEQYIYP